MRRAIVKILTDDRVNLDDFKKNPQMFTEGVSRIIIKNVRSMALKGIKYTKIGDFYAQELFESEELTGYLNKNLVETKRRGLYEYTVYDSDIELKSALQLESMPNVKLFVKLPEWFRITTPIGDYNPDWAVLMDGTDGNHLYFVFETKGNLDNNRASEEFKIKCGIKHFEALGNEVRYLPTTDIRDYITGEFYLEEKY
jgi:type III restriction enzyme